MLHCGQKHDGTGRGGRRQAGEESLLGGDVHALGRLVPQQEPGSPSIHLALEVPIP